MMQTDRDKVIYRLIHNSLKPYVKKIDMEAWYPLEYMEAIGKSGLLRSEGLSEPEAVLAGVRIIEDTAKTCMTTAFNLWCHFAALTYLRKCRNDYLRNRILPLMENGELLGGTGLSNPMKYYAGLEKLRLKATQTDGGYLIDGQLPMVSNLGAEHWFAVIASVDEQQRVMAFVPCNAQNLAISEQTHYLGLNGSATYSCKFDQVFIPQEWIVSEQADEFVEQIRSTFILYQIPLALGVIAASIDSIHHARDKQGGCNKYLVTQPEELKQAFTPLQEHAYRLANSADLAAKWKEVLQLRLNATNLAMTAVHACMLHHGGAGYIQHSDPARRLRESYFLVNLTPSIRHLSKLTQA